MFLLQAILSLAIFVFLRSTIAIGDDGNIDAKKTIVDEGKWGRGSLNGSAPKGLRMPSNGKGATGNPCVEGQRDNASGSVRRPDAAMSLLPCFIPVMRKQNAKTKDLTSLCRSRR
ncbi:hypothetical protein B0T16DRAFT_224626 [Cercophora newfieldiana]|uniref:Secreted protein n=1 Tax=Cercophora newfieldiana TaxID=92897 RepID=A0AA39XXI4_9PEZI|nr:hypothetical protein B0T16DRAFT_224626 [Cercophora newfieldiana]